MRILVLWVAVLLGVSGWTQSFAEASGQNDSNKLKEENEKLYREFQTKIILVDHALFFLLQSPDDVKPLESKAIHFYPIDVHTPTTARLLISAADRKDCELNNKKMKEYKKELKKFAGEEVTVQFDVNDMEQIGQYVWIPGIAELKNGDSVSDIMISMGAGVKKTDKIPDEWWKDPMKCMI